MQKRSVRIRPDGRNPEPIGDVIDRLIGSLGPPRWTPPDRATLEVVADIIKYVASLPRVPRKAKDSLGIALAMLEGRRTAGGGR